jgi:Family of unknown function (DUF6599)
MKARILAYLLALLLCLPVLAGAAETHALLPEHFGPWTSGTPITIRSGPGLYKSWGDAQTANLKEAGLRSFEERSYNDGKEDLKVALYTFNDPTGAYEFYTQSIAPGMESGGIGDESALDAHSGTLLVGNLVIELGPFSALDPKSLTGLLSALKPAVDKTPFPQLKSYLPDHWRVFGSEKYALGPTGFRSAMNSLGQAAFANLANDVGFESKAEAILARYQGEHGSGVLLLLEYPTPQLAEQHLRHLREALPEAAKREGVTVERKTSLLSMVFAPSSPLHAQAIRDAVNYETQVTWNESSHTATDPPIVVIMVKIFLFTGLFLGVATGVGIAFGGLRVIIKRLFPGKVFDRPQDIEVLQLGLSGKKIDPTDMY